MMTFLASRGVRSFSATALALGAALLNTPALAESPEVAPAASAPVGDDEVIELEKMFVTGSAVPVAKGREFQPITRLDRSDFLALGASTAPEVLRSMPAFFGEAGTEQRSNGGTGAAGTNLRGMGGVLVLLDGHRTAAFDEVNLIPMVALGRVDVVKDSAGARYGADALTGVVNLSLTPSFRGQRIEAFYGNTTDKDAAVLRVGLLAGEGNAWTDVVVGAEYYHRNALMASDRKVSASSDGRSRGGQNLGSAFVSGRTTASRSGGPPESLALRPGVAAAFSASDYVPFDTSANTSNQFQNTREFTPSIPEQEGKSAYARINQKIIEGGVLEAHARLLFSHNEYDSAVVSTAATLGSATVSASPHLPAGLTPAAGGTTYVRFDSLRRGRRYDRDGYDFQAGLKGRIGESWSWDATYVYGWWYRNDTQTGALSGAPLIASVLSGAYNPFADDSARGVNPNNGVSFDNPAALRAASVTGRIDRDFGVRGFDARASGTLFQLPAGPLETAVGVDYFITEQSTVPDATIVNTGFVGFNSTGFSTAESESRGVFAEAIIPLVGGNQDIPFLRELSVMVSARRSEKEISGTTPGNGATVLARTFRETTPKFGVRYSPFRDLRMRATYAEGFRTPSLSSVFSALSTFSPSLRDPLGFGFAPVRTISTQGNPGLEPEKSKSWSAGAVYTPAAARGLTLEVTYYQSEITNLVGEGAQYILNVNASSQGTGFTPGMASGIDPSATFASRITRNAAGQITALRSTPFNIAARETSGLEYAAIYRWPKIGQSDFTSRLEANTTLSWDLTPLKGQPSQNWLGRYVDISTNSISPGSIPRHKGRFVQEWRNGAWAANASMRHVSSLQDDALWTYLNRPRRIGSWTTFDAQVSYTFAGLLRTSRGSGLRVDVGVSNLTDKEPPFAAAAVNDGYDITLHSNRGRFLYTQLTKTF